MKISVNGHQEEIRENIDMFRDEYLIRQARLGLAKGPPQPERAAQKAAAPQRRQKPQAHGLLRRPLPT